MFTLEACSLWQSCIPAIPAIFMNTTAKQGGASASLYCATTASWHDRRICGAGSILPLMALHVYASARHIYHVCLHLTYWTPLQAFADISDTAQTGFGISHLRRSGTGVQK